MLYGRQVIDNRNWDVVVVVVGWTMGLSSFCFFTGLCTANERNVMRNTQGIKNRGGDK